jgi:uncharacterized protein YodC (DUF2158 family)
MDKTESERDKIVVGDIVVIKSGSPKMVVASITKRKRVTCIYSEYGTNNIRVNRLPMVILKKL